jgi:N6-adenosine-specific RNA methylase IME4
VGRLGMWRSVSSNVSSRLYSTIVADPPWAYPEGFPTTPFHPHRQERERGAKSDTPIVSVPLPYPSLSLEEITALPVNVLAASNCRLFLWTTSRYLPDAFRILVAWGFTYKQMLVWDKRPKVSPFTGSVAGIAAEFLLVAVQGKPPRLAKWPASVVTASKARGQHSRKPDVFLDLIETVSPGPYLELFARRQRLGWDTWGNEALEHVEVVA